MKLKKINLKKNKKASIEDIFFFIITMLGFALFILIIAYVVPRVSDEMKKTDLNDSAAVRNMFNEEDKIINKLNPVYLIIFAGLIISIFISSFMIYSHPIFIPVYILLLGFAVIFGVIANNVYDEFAANALLSPAEEEQIYMHYIWDNFILILVGVGIISMIIIFAKPLQGSRI